MGDAGPMKHAWGDIAPSDANWSHWDEAIVHGRAGQATIAYGLNRTDAGIDPDVRDARWLGLLATAHHSAASRIQNCLSGVDATLRRSNSL
jgi:hypothetical protein